MNRLSASDLARYQGKVSSLKDVVERVHDQWIDQDRLIALVDEVSQSVSQDMDDLYAASEFLFEASMSSHEQTEQNVELIRRWHILNKPPSLVALCVLAIENMSLSLSEETINAVLLAGILGEVENDNPYHNNIHFKKVLLQTIRMITAHNDIYAGTAHAFSDEHAALLLLAACIHDIGHDGKGNTVKGMFIQGRLELQSFELAEPYLLAAGYNDPANLEYLKTMLLCTDTSPLGELSNPMNQMKAAYRFHFLGDKTKTHALNLDPEFSRLPKDEKLTVLCLVLHEADIATSAGLDYAVTQYETISFMRELRDDQAYPEQVLDFFNQICQRKMLSDAAQRLYASNMARIYALAEEEVQNGNHAYPDLKHSDLILSAQSSGHQGTKTLN